MTYTRRTSTLYALLSLSIACTGGGGDTDTDTESSMTAAMTESPSTSEGTTGAGPSTDGPTGGETEGASSSGDATGDATGEETDATTGDATTTAGGELCDEYCALLDSCGESTGDCVADCELSVAYYGSVGSCHDPFTAVYECIIGLDCAAYDEFVTAEGEYPCKAELEAYSGESFPPCAADDPPAACTTYCGKIDECGFDEGTPVECLASCALTLGAEPLFGEACVTAYEALYDCYSAAACQDFDSPDLCDEENTAVEAVCF
ncbi:MAG: hypothetical protein H6713_33360 [Myxococcales bacterium]|nr:hypothetical protein [Myxococcales bacterium]MCB9754851.1 hypothetical protein [Myxococcales bacterium]